MAESFGPRTYLVGQILNGMAANPNTMGLNDYKVLMAIEMADTALDLMQGKVPFPVEEITK